MTSTPHAPVAAADRLDLRLQAMLEEYKALRSEIQYRSQGQLALIRLHVTTVTVVVGALIVQAGQPYAPGLLLLIPLEAIALGLWYLDSSAAVSKIAARIRGIEAAVNGPEFFGAPTLTWESRGGGAFAGPFWITAFRGLIGATFAGPGLAATAVAAVWFWQSSATYAPWQQAAVPAVVGIETLGLLLYVMLTLKIPAVGETEPRAAVPDREQGEAPSGESMQAS